MIGISASAQKSGSSSVVRALTWRVRPGGYGPRYAGLVSNTPPPGGQRTMRKAGLATEGLAKIGLLAVYTVAVVCDAVKYPSTTDCAEKTSGHRHHQVRAPPWRIWIDAELFHDEESIPLRHVTQGHAPRQLRRAFPVPKRHDPSRFPISIVISKLAPTNGFDRTTK